ncbi:MAG: hypothetical protein DSZ06_01615 [Sulfurospirillum sp.]|nr:MAG: hypothetical protein DSZ06_01615 [Sulfurospirillum sp.]
MRYIILVLLVLQNFLWGFDYQNISLNFADSDKIHILKRLDIDEDFIYDKELNDLINDLKKYDIILFQRAIEKNPEIFSTLKQIVQKSTVPDQFLYMAMIESQFLIHAKSHKKAAGLWQILPNTAKLLKLKIDKNIDERLDPIKSTKAAIKYLDYLHQRFKKWYLVAFAYNCGETRLARAIRDAKSDNIFVLLDSSQKYIPKETKDYIRRLIVAALVANSKPIIKSASKIKKEDSILGTISMKESKSIKDIANSLHIDAHRLHNYNAHILTPLVPKGANLYLLKKYIKGDRLKVKSSYTLKKDSTLYALSKKFHTPFEILKKLNPHLKSFLIKKGTKINLPKINIAKSKITFKKTSSTKSSLKEKTEHISKKNEKLVTISLRFNNKISTIKNLNPDVGQNKKKGNR